LFKTVRENIQTIFTKNRIAKSVPEAIFCYPGPEVSRSYMLTAHGIAEQVGPDEGRW